MKREIPFFNFFNLLRVVFALIVFFYHLSYARYGHQLNSLYELDLGHYAVAGFFFISGFFITHLLKSDLSDSAFIKNRFYRIYPVLTLCLILTFLMDKIGSTLYPQLYSGDVYNSQNVTNQFLQTLIMINQFWNNNIRFGTNGPLWSLSYEVWYYVLIFIFFRCGKFRYFALIPFLLIMGPNLWLLLPCYVLGSLFYCSKDNLPKIPTSALPFVLITIILHWFFWGRIILRFMGQYSWHTLYNLRYSLNFVSDIIFTLLLFILSAVFYQNPDLLEKIGSKFWKVTNHLTKRTYTFYLFHYPLLLFVSALWISSGHEAGTDLSLIFCASVAMVICYLLGSVETRLLRAKK